MFDIETTTDTAQDLTLGAFRRCRLVRDRYVCVEEGLIRADAVNRAGMRVLDSYARRERPDIAVQMFPPRLALPVLSRADFVEKRLWRSLQAGEMVVGFNLPFDLSRLAVDWRTARDGGWSLILSLRLSRLTGKLEPNPERPRIHITARTSKSGFINLQRPRHADEWRTEARFLDLHTLAAALFERSYSLEQLCKDLKVRGKADHTPSGRITVEEIRYCREDVRATVDVLNGLRAEFNRHRVALNPDRATSPASFAKAHFDQMGIIPPQEQFRVPNRILGIAMQAYYGGRAECRIRHVEVPVIHTDFKSQYPTVNSLLGNWNVLTAERLTFEDATDDVRAMLSTLTLDSAFDPRLWKRLSFFALVQSENGIFPVRSLYNGATPNIGSSVLQTVTPLWFAGPDVIASLLLTGRAPKIVRAIRMMPHGRQEGLRPISLRGAVKIDPQTDFFRKVVEQRERRPKRDPLSKFLKTLANSGSYGLFVEINPKPRRRGGRITVFAGERSHRVLPPIIEQPGRWYFPPIAALITAGGRLLLAMLERCVTDRGGSYLFCDTDSLCIVAGEHGGRVPCPTTEQADATV